MNANKVNPKIWLLSVNVEEIHLYKFMEGPITV